MGSNDMNEVATKHDRGKLRYDLMPPDALDQVVGVLTYGANKYGDRNWEKGFSWGRLFGATMRHLWSWWRGEAIDVESGYSHLAHAAAGTLMLLATVTRGIGKDDRGEFFNGSSDHERA